MIWLYKAYISKIRLPALEKRITSVQMQHGITRPSTTASEGISEIFRTGKSEL